MAGLSKTKLLAHRQCPKRLWLETYRRELAGGPREAPRRACRWAWKWAGLPEACTRTAC